MKYLSIIAMTAMIAASCGSEAALVPAKNFDQQIDGKQVALYTIKGGDVIAQITNFGGRVVSLFVPDSKGGLTDVVYGHKTLDEYVNYVGERFVGCCVGPVANRIAKGCFTIDGMEYNLPINNGLNTLHGGFKGVDLVVWDVVEVRDNSITMKVLNADGTEGFPGNTEITMTYMISDSNALVIEYSAVSDKKTPINLSHHAMFNVGGECTECIEDQVMCINADFYTPVEETMIPTGEIRPVEGTPFDFRKPKAIGRDINVDDVQLAISRGFDHNWCLNKSCQHGNCAEHNGSRLAPACCVWSPATGIMMQVLTDQPGIQFYSGNFFDGNGVGKNGKPAAFRTAIALETQNYPDAVNQPGFPCSVYEPGQIYTHSCVYKFTVSDGKCCCGE